MGYSRRELNKIKCKEKILKASRWLFNKKGFENTTIEEIAMSAEISNATFYNYFPTKESLLIGAAEDLYDLHAEYVNEKLADELNKEKKIRKAIEFIILDIQPFASLSRKMNYLNACSDSPLYHRMRIKDIIYPLVIDAQKSGDIKQIYDPEYISDIYISVFYLAIFSWHDFEDHSKEYCSKKINQYLDLALEKIITKEPEVSSDE